MLYVNILNQKPVIHSGTVIKMRDTVNREVTKVSTASKEDIRERGMEDLVVFKV